MDDDAVKLLFVRLVEEFCIGANGVKTDEEVAAKAVAFTIVEGDDVGEVVMLQVLTIYFDDLFVIAEDVGYFTDAFAVTGGDGLDPCRSFGTRDGGKVDVDGMIGNHEEMLEFEDFYLLTEGVVRAVVSINYPIGRQRERVGKYWMCRARVLDACRLVPSPRGLAVCDG